VGNVEYVTTQFYFESALNDEVLSMHPLYNTRGAPDTTNANDGIYPNQPEPYVLKAERMPDGVMLASKAIVIRSAIGTPLCSA
jgi:hypothetical protein